MQQTAAIVHSGAGERKRVEAVVETLANLHSRGESLAEVAHDARNMVTALALYCDLLEEPGVLASPFTHYAGELRLVAAASRRLVEKLVALDQPAADGPRTGPLPGARPKPGNLPATVASARSAESVSGHAPHPSLVRHERWDQTPAQPITNLAAELLSNRTLLAALAGPAIAVTMDAASGARPVRLTAEDLTRVLVNLVKNAAEALPAGGRIQITLAESAASAGLPMLILTVEDNGPGIPVEALEKIFESGYTTHGQAVSARGGWAAAHRGLGLTITRSLIESAGGRIYATPRPQGGARLVMELPAAE